MNDFDRIRRLLGIELAADAYSASLNRYSVYTVRRGDATDEVTAIRHELLLSAQSFLILLRNTDLKAVEDSERAQKILIEGCSLWTSHASITPLPEQDIEDHKLQLTACHVLAKAVRKARLSMPGGANTAIPRDLITQTAAGEFADTDRSTICRMVSDGKLTGFGKHNSVSRAEVESIMPIRKRRRRTTKGNLE